MLTDLQQSLQTKYPHITFNHERCIAHLPSSEHTEELVDLLIVDGYMLMVSEEECEAFEAEEKAKEEAKKLTNPIWWNLATVKWLRENLNNPDYPLLHPLSKLRKDKLDSTLKVLSYVFYFSCYAPPCPTNLIFMGQDFIAEKMGFSRATVTRAVRTLLDLHILMAGQKAEFLIHKSSEYYVNPEIFIMAVLVPELGSDHHRQDGGMLGAIGSYVHITKKYDTDGSFLRSEVLIDSYELRSNLMAHGNWFNANAFPNKDNNGVKVTYINEDKPEELPYWYTPCVGVQIGRRNVTEYPKIECERQEIYNKISNNIDNRGSLSGPDSAASEVPSIVPEISTDETESVDVSSDDSETVQSGLMEATKTGPRSERIAIFHRASTGLKTKIYRVHFSSA